MYRDLVLTMANAYDRDDIEMKFSQLLQHLVEFVPPAHFIIPPIHTVLCRRKPASNVFDVFKSLELGLQAYFEETNYIVDSIVIEDKEFRCYVPRQPINRGVLVRKIEVTLPSATSVNADDYAKEADHEKVVRAFLEVLLTYCRST